MTAADPDIRQSVLRYASALAGDPADAIGVVVNAIPLLGWLEEAPDKADQLQRRACMDRHCANLFFVGDPGESVTPEQFLAGVRVLYAFITEAIEPECAA